MKKKTVLKALLAMSVVSISLVGITKGSEAVIEAHMIKESPWGKPGKWVSKTKDSYIISFKNNDKIYAKAYFNVNGNLCEYQLEHIGSTVFLNVVRNGAVVEMNQAKMDVKNDRFILYDLDGIIFGSGSYFYSFEELPDNII